MSLPAAVLAAAPWIGWRPASCLPDHCFCEAVREGLVRQPVNAASSLAFLVVAGLVAVDAAGRGAAERSRLAAGSAGLFIAALVLIGAGSAFYHTSLSFAGQFLDVLGMYLIATLLLLLAVTRRRACAPRALWSLYIAANAALAVALYAAPGLRRYLFALLVVAAVAVEGAAGRPRGEFRLALVIFLVAFGAWVADITGIACVPGSILQGHALWHILAAVAVWPLWRHYRSHA